MLHHYLKIAFRNLRKFRTQNIISIIGLAVGFVCFSLSVMWIRYERGFDNFHPKSDRIYLVQTYPRKWDTQNADASVKNQYSSYSLARHLKMNFPEIEDVCLVDRLYDDRFSVIFVDSSFFNVFDLPAPPNHFFVRSTLKPAMITKDFMATDVLKEELEYDVQSVISRWPLNTNIPFQVISPLWVNNSEEVLSISNANNPDWWLRSSKTFKAFVLLRKNIDLQRLEEKLDSIIIANTELPTSVSLVPIKKLRYNDPDKTLKNDLKFSHIYIFSLSGLLVILCALFNHITLYVSQMQMRMREFALRKVNGSSNGQIIQLLYLEFLIVLFISLVAGLLFLASCIPYYMNYVGIENSAHIITELLIYTVAIIMIAVVSGLFPILHFRKRTLMETIQVQHAVRNKNLFRKVSLVLQLTISIGLLFCSLVILKQMKFLTGTDLGISRRNIASVEASCCPFNDSYYKDKLKQIPGITDVLMVSNSRFLKNIITYSTTTTSFINTKIESQLHYDVIGVDNHFFEFFNIDIIEGVNFSNVFHDYKSNIDNDMVINETMAKGFEGNMIGQRIGMSKVVGISKDFYISPTQKIKPAAMNYPDVNNSFFSLKALAYKYEEGMRQQTQQAITQWIRDEFPEQEANEITFTYMEDVFEEHFKAERTLLFLLSITTSVCILIAIFGVFSLTSLTCRQRRKEIAIRKINGAEVLDIMNIFFKEYLILLALAAFVAFPAGYLIMKRWMEGYVKQTSLDAWLFVLIFLIVFMIIVFSIVTMVWKAANRNPAEVVKSE